MAYDSEQLRLLVNLDQHYEVWLSTARQLAEERLKWKTVKGREYLYRISDRYGTDTSIGPRDSQTEAKYAEYEVARTTRNEIARTLEVDSALYRALKLPMVAAFAGDILRELDIRQMLGTSLLVVGTVALVAYEIEAKERLPSGFDTTDDFDLTWSYPILGKPEPETPNALLAALKKVDATYTLNAEREFQIRNAKGYEIELLLAASISKEWATQQRLQPIPLPEQDWLLLGTQVSHVICDMGGKAARIVVPDPRWFGLHKLWLSKKPARNPLKVTKDMQQGQAILNLVANHMPRFALDAAFKANLPPELLPYYESWSAGK